MLAMLRDQTQFRQKFNCCFRIYIY